MCSQCDQIDVKIARLDISLAGRWISKRSMELLI